MTPSELAELERLERRSHRAPWFIDVRGDGLIYSGGKEQFELCVMVGSLDDPDDEEFTVALRNAAPSLILTARRAQRAREVLEKAVNSVQTSWRAAAAHEALAILRGERDE